MNKYIEYCSYRHQWSLFKVQLAVLVVVYKLTLIWVELIISMQNVH